MTSLADTLPVGGAVGILLLVLIILLILFLIRRL